MSKLLSQIRSMLRDRSNCKRVNQVGTATKLTGIIDRRSPGATINIGSRCLIEGRLVAERAESHIDLADNVLVGGGTVIDCVLSVIVERDVLISYDCIIVDADNHSLLPEKRVGDLEAWMNRGFHDWTDTAMASVRICQGAWIGARSIILKGVTIGAGAVVGMGSVVTRDVPPRTVVAGNPARVIRSVDNPSTEGTSGLVQ